MSQPDELRSNAKQTENQPDVLENYVDYTEFAYDRMTVEDIAAITEDVIKRADAQTEVIVTSEELTWDSIMAPLSAIKDQGAQATGRALFMAHVHPDKAVRDVAVEAETKINHHTNELQYRRDLYEKIKAYSETPSAQMLEGEEARSLQRTMRAFKRLGHELEPIARARMQELNRKLSDNSTEFDQNVREDKTEVLLSADELAGMSKSYVDGLKQDEEGNYKVTMQYPHVVPIFNQALKRSTRQKVSRAFNSRAMDNNRPVLEDTLQMRQEMAGIMGYASWAHYKLEDRMAKTPETVKAFYAELTEPLAAKGEAEITVLTDMLRADGYEGSLKTYDRLYYDAKLRERDHGVNQEKVAEHFPLNATLDGLFQITGEAFGLKYRPIDIPTWHEDVLAFAIDDAQTGEQIATFYMDLFPRDGKYNHAAAFSLQRGRELPDGSYRQPASAIVANFTKPTATSPSLLKHQEVSTLFHEFGHILHQTLTQARLVEFSGTNVERDFVEAPSQIMEHWVEDADILQRFAKHYETGEPFPEELVGGIVASQKLNVALNTLRQMSVGYLDMAMHDESANKDLDQILKDSSALSLLPHEEGTFFPASFGHIMHGYDAGYYGYLWSEVYGDDMFSRFKREGLTNPTVGLEYRHKILERGGTVDAIDMLRDFLGREPNNEAFLENQGISA